MRLIGHLDVLVHRFLSARFPKGDQLPDIGPADFQLMSLVDRAGAATMTAVAGGLDVPLSTATNRVDRLVKIGVLCRERSDSDRRIVEVKLSDSGRELVAAGHEVRLAMGRAMLAALSPGEREILIELMQKMSERATA
ncbi:MAG: MarR family transcriptional regulator [Bryobacteraceae bacterium]|nr:MarR family transcriptional regulator [Bryobacteraceae bacterium]